MSLEKIQRQQEAQIKIKAQIELKKTQIEQEKLIQHGYKLKAEKNKTKIEKSNWRISGINVQSARVAEDVAVIKLGAARDGRQYEKAMRLLKQKGYAAKLTLEQVALNDQILTVGSNARKSGSQAIGLISASELSMPAIEVSYLQPATEG
jgi:hypothetical protein